MGPRSFVTLVLALCVPSAASATIGLQRTYDGPVAGGEFGYACAIIGDMDGDGIPEFAIGAPGDATGGAEAGRVFIYRGGDPLPDTPAWVITGLAGDRLGHSLAGGYVDDDFVPDLVMGAPGSLDQPGRVLIAYGSNPLGARTVRSVEGTTAGGRFGWAVATLTKWGFYPVRFIVGAPEANGGAGEVHGLTNGDPPPSARAFVLHGVSAGERFGCSVADAAVTRGFLFGPEFLVGAPESPIDAPSAGRFALFFHDTPDDTLPDFEAHGAAAGERLGFSVTGGEDTNPNYFEPSAEFVAGAPGASPGGVTGSGRAPVSSGFDIHGDTPAAALGSTVRLLASVTRSGLPDLAVAEGGAVRVYSGPLDPSAPPVAVLLAEAADGGFGHAISNAGRIGPALGPQGQFLVGAPDYEGAGRVYVYSDPAPIVGVDEPIITGVSLGAPKPNPASGTVSFAVDLPRAMHARIALYDLTGREIARVHEGGLGPGRASFTWDSRRGAGPGLYFVTFEAAGVRSARRLAVIR